MRMVLALGLSALSCAALAQSAGQGDLSVTIYNSDLGLIQDVRQVALPAGVSRQEFPDVSASIRPETVTLSGDGFGIVEQNFDYDLLSPDALMQKAVGQTVTLLRTNPATGAETRERARVLAVNNGVVLQIGERIEVLRDDGLPVRVIFDSIPANLRARPTLSVTVDAPRGGTRPLTLSYLSRGLGWKADYVALFDEPAGRIDVQGWVTLTNNTGTSFANARTLLVAGDVAQVNQGYDARRYQPPRQPQPRGNTPGTETANREGLGDFYAYPLDQRTTIANAQQKQVSFLDVAGVPATRGYEYRNPWLGKQDEAQSAASVLKFSTARQGGLGDALPAGIVRVYVRDARGQAQFIGESGIGHTPGGSSLALKTGDAFDVKVLASVVERTSVALDEWERVARWRVTDADGSVRTSEVEFQKQFYRTRMRYTVTNAKPVAVTVDVIQSGLNQWYWWRDTRVPEESIKGTQLDADRRLWPVAVPANGKVDLDVTFLTRW